MPLATKKTVAPAGERIALAALATASIRPVAHVIASDRAIDLALSLSPNRLVVLRCVDEASTEDHTVLATMVAQGDFVWAGVVYSTQLPEVWPGSTEAFRVSELPRLIERLQGLQRAAAS